MMDPSKRPSRAIAYEAVDTGLRISAIASKVAMIAVAAELDKLPNRAPNERAALESTILDMIAVHQTRIAVTYTRTLIDNDEVFNASIERLKELINRECDDKEAIKRRSIGFMLELILNLTKEGDSHAIQ